MKVHTKQAFIIFFLNNETRPCTNLFPLISLKVTWAPAVMKDFEIKKNIVPKRYEK